MDSISFSAATYKVKPQKKVHPKLKMTPQMVRDEENRILRVQARIKQQAIDEIRREKKWVKIRQFNNKLAQCFSQIIEACKIEFPIKL